MFRLTKLLSEFYPIFKKRKKKKTISLKEVIKFIEGNLVKENYLVRKYYDITLIIPTGSHKIFGDYDVSEIQITDNDIDSNIGRFTIEIILSGHVYEFKEAKNVRDLFREIEKKYNVRIFLENYSKVEEIFPGNVYLELNVLSGLVYFEVNISMNYQRFKELVESKKIYDLLKDIQNVLKKYRRDEAEVVEKYSKDRELKNSIV